MNYEGNNTITVYNMMTVFYLAKYSKHACSITKQQKWNDASI